MKVFLRLSLIAVASVAGATIGAFVGVMVGGGVSSLTGDDTYAGYGLYLGTLLGAIVLAFFAYRVGRRTLDA
jgi:hypothetical protein